jgi:hypothetical protein
MKVAPLLSSKPAPTLSPRSTPPPSKYAWSVFYPMQAVPENKDEIQTNNNDNKNDKNDKKENVGNEYYKKVKFGW